MDASASDEIDFLLEKSKSSGNNEDLSKLWKATLNLPQWHFLARQTETLADRTPFIGVLANKPWVFLFTDRQRAHEYGRHINDGGFVDADGNVLIISMETQHAISYIMSLASKGVYGLRMNELNGWFSPLANLPAIINYVNSK